MKYFKLILFYLSLTTMAANPLCGEASGDKVSIYKSAYENTIIKVSKFLVAENLKSLEDYALVLKRKITKDNKEEIAAIYKRYVSYPSFEVFEKSLSNYSYWTASRRLEPVSAAAILSIMKEIEKIELTPVEIRLIWVLRLVTDIVEKEKGKFSSEYNLYNISSQIVRFTGAVSGTRILKDELNPSDCADLISEEEVNDLFWEILEDESDFHFEEGSFKKGDNVIFQMKQMSALRGTPVEYVKIPDHRGELELFPDFKKFRKEYYKINQKRNIDIIHFYHENYKRVDYVVIDKDQKKAYFYNSDNEVDDIQEIEIGHDDRVNRDGAGIYLMGERSLVSQIGTQATIDESLNIPAGTIVYILPQDKSGLKFQIKNYKLGFYSMIKRANYNAFNLTSRDDKKIKTTFSIFTDSEYLKEYAETLGKEKEKLMQIYGMDSDTYNMIALYAFGVLSPETNMAVDRKYIMKELVPFGVSLLKGNGFDTSANSRGATQLKKIPKKILENYSFDKSDLLEARYAAIATIGFSYEIYLELKGIAKYHPDINDYNIFDYLYYIYRGKRYEIKNATATPEKNISIRRIKRAINRMQVTDEI